MNERAHRKATEDKAGKEMTQILHRVVTALIGKVASSLQFEFAKAQPGGRQSSRFCNAGEEIRSWDILSRAAMIPKSRTRRGFARKFAFLLLSHSLVDL
jgi:hypothetical protein